MSVVLPAGKHKARVHQRVLLESALAADAADMPDRKKPNILITGTPGTGKTTHADLLASETKLQHVVIGDLVREHELHDGYDEEFDAYTMNDDKVRLTYFNMSSAADSL
jgi:replication-associated recombination protein RarA